MITSRTCRHWKFPKSWLRTLGYRQKNIPLFLFPQMGHSLQNICLSYAPYILMYSVFTHNAVVLSAFRCVHLENQTKIFRFFTFLWIKTNVAYTRLEMIARTKYFTTTTASNWFVTLYYKLLPAVRSSSKHGRRWSSLLLYSIYVWVWLVVLY